MVITGVSKHRKGTVKMWYKRTKMVHLQRSLQDWKLLWVS